MGYHAAGITNLVFYAIALAGTAHQLTTIWQRRAAAGPGGRATALISLNQLSVSFFGYYAFFVYGFCVRPFNHYLVWPRLAGLLLVLTILFELFRDRRDRPSRTVFVVSGGALFAALAVLLARPEIDETARRIPQALAVVATGLLVQGFGHQIVLVRRAREVGAVSIWMHVATFIKDFSLAGLGAAMGLSAGWPLLLMGVTSVLVKSLLIAHLFRYSRVR